MLTLSLLACGGDDPAPDDLDEELMSPRDAGSSRDGGARDGGARDARVSDARVSSDARAPVQEGKPDAQVAEVVKKGRSAGCGQSGSGTGKYEKATLKVGEQDRGYALLVPKSYDKERAYPAVVRFHGTGGDGVSGGMDIQNESGEDAIIISPDGLNKAWADGTEPADIAFFDALLSDVGARYCVDLDNVFAYGFSAGAGLSQVLACKRGAQLRGVAAIAGYPRGNNTGCQGPVAAWLSHDKNDEAIPLIGGTLARGRLLQQNSCGTMTESDGAGCLRYVGCTDGYPVVWCESEGLGHNIRGDYAPKAVWDFFSGL